MAEPVTIVSLGYEGRTLSDFLAELKRKRVRRLLDVREVALSRRVEYRRGALERALNAEGIEYEHASDAGNPYRKLKQSIKACLAAYRTHVISKPEMLRRVRARLRKADGLVAVLCYERDHDFCHRSVLLDVLRKNGLRLKVLRVE